MRLRGWGRSQVPPVPGTLVGMGKQAGHVAAPPPCGRRPSWAVSEQNLTLSPPQF